MALKREDFEKGGTVLVVTRTGNGAAVQERRRKARVIDFNRAACKLEWLDDRTKSVTIPFTQLEADPDWLDERDAREDERQRKLDDARRQSLTVTLGEKLAAKNEPVPVLVTDQVRADALAQIAALGSARPTHDEQRESEQRCEERVEAHHAPKDGAPPKPVDQLPLDQVQHEIDQLESEQTALIEMLLPIEERLKALKQRRKALKPPARLRASMRAFAVGGER